MRTLNLLNGPEGSQTGIEDGFQFLKKSGKVDEVLNFYYQAHISKFGILDSLRTIKEVAVKFEAEIIIIYHVSGYPIPKEFYGELKSLKSKPILVCDEHDGYEKFRKPLPKTTKQAMAEAHVISLCGLGSMIDLVPKRDQHKIIFTPHQTTIQRYDTEWTPSRSRKYDVVMIGNRIKSRIPFKTLSGSKEREKLIRLLGECFQERLAVYGRGWHGFVGNKGYLDYHQQINAIRESWISVGVDHCIEMAYYFSDRLPNNLFSGVAHVCHYHAGYETLFEQGKNLIWFNTPEEAIDNIRVMLSRGPEYLIKLGENGRKKAKECFSPEVVWGNFIDTIKQL